MSRILIVIDMQNDFVYGSLGSVWAQNIVSNVTAKIKEFDGEVFFTQDSHAADYLDTQEGTYLPVSHCQLETHGWELVHEIKALGYIEESHIVLKPAFGSRELAERLYKKNKEQKIESIELIGVCTDICVISNALIIKAFLPETKLIVDSSCCAGVTPKSHETALEAMKACQIEII